MTSRDPSDPRQTPISLRKELLAQGWSDKGIARMVAEGTWQRARRGAYVDGSAWRRLDRVGRHEVRSRAVLKQGKTELALSHCSGLPIYDGSTWGFNLSDVHVTRLDGKAGRSEAGVRQHRGKVLDGDVVTRYGVPVMSATRLGLEVTTMGSTEAAFVAVSDLVRAGHTTVADLRDRYARGMEHWEGSLRTDVVLRLVRPAMESVGEFRFFYLCYAQGLPAPVPQYEVVDRDGNVVARLDFAWPELGVFAEFDGRVKYGALLKPGESASDVVVREKRRENLVVELTGWRGIRAVWDDLDHPERTGLRLRQLLFPETRWTG